MNQLKVQKVIAAKRAAEVGRAREDVALVEGKIAAARQVLAGADKERQQHMVAAAKGDAEAITAIAEVRRKSIIAAEQVADYEAVLPGLKRRLADAEAAERSARLAILDAAAEADKQKLVEVSAEIDDHFAKLMDAIARRDALGADLLDHHIEKLAARGYAIGSGIEAARGDQRLLGAFPPRLIRRLLPNVILPDHMPLADSDGDFWQVKPPTSDDSEAAA